MTARNSIGEENDAMFTPDHEDNSNGIIDSLQGEGRVQLKATQPKYPLYQGRLPVLKEV